QQLAALKSFYNSWGGAAALLPQSILSAAAVAAASAASLPPTSHVLAHHPPVNAAEASAPVFSLDNLRCIKCSKQFYSPMAVQQHIIAEHSEAAPRAHICPFCDAAFTTQHALQTHMPCRMQSLSHQYREQLG
uniref:C2H2-type domain-containing protein n=1 Tax=Romanomermis culicivorax TaxID=13658 RepID=A0A915HJE3_ROMCU